MQISESYDSAAQAYAEHLAGELVHKPLDRHLLSRFAEEMRGRGLVADLGCGPGHISRGARPLVSTSPRAWSRWRRASTPALISVWTI
jgi:hypothetical protein